MKRCGTLSTSYSWILSGSDWDGRDYGADHYSLDQELAIASYLGLDVLAFREFEATLEGLLAFVGANAETFDDRKMLPKMVADTVRDRLTTGRWSTAWRTNW